MIESKLDNTRIINREPSLESYYPENESTWDNLKNEALLEIIQDARDAGFKVRKLCKRLSLHDSSAVTATYTGVTSDEDIVERSRVIIRTSAKSGTGTATFQLQGSDDETNWNTITTSENLSVTNTGDVTATFNDFYKYYRLNLTAFTLTSITFEAYLIETTYEYLHLLKSLELIYMHLIAVEGDVWKSKRDEYRALYLDRFNNTQFIYDEDDSGEISDDENSNVEVVFAP